MLLQYHNKHQGAPSLQIDNLHKIFYQYSQISYSKTLLAQKYEFFSYNQTCKIWFAQFFFWFSIGSINVAERFDFAQFRHGTPPNQAYLYEKRTETVVISVLLYPLRGSTALLAVGSRVLESLHPPNLPEREATPGFSPEWTQKTKPPLQKGGLGDR